MGRQSRVPAVLFGVIGVWLLVQGFIGGADAWRGIALLVASVGGTLTLGVIVQRRRNSRRAAELTRWRPGRELIPVLAPAVDLAFVHALAGARTRRGDVFAWLVLGSRGVEVWGSRGPAPLATLSPRGENPALPGLLGLTPTRAAIAVQAGPALQLWTAPGEGGPRAWDVGIRVSPPGGWFGMGYGSAEQVAALAQRLAARYGVPQRVPDVQDEPEP